MADTLDLMIRIMEDQPMPQVIDDLVAEVAKDVTVMDGAITFIQGVPAIVQAAIDKALANGATQAQLAPVTQVVTDLAAKRDALAAALAANVPADALASAKGKKH